VSPIPHIPEPRHFVPVQLSTLTYPPVPFSPAFRSMSIEPLIEYDRCKRIIKRHHRLFSELSISFHQSASTIGQDNILVPYDARDPYPLPRASGYSLICELPSLGQNFQPSCKNIPHDEH
jgi:hypothetical protein